MDRMIWYRIFSSYSFKSLNQGRRKWRGEKWDDPWSARTFTILIFDLVFDFAKCLFTWGHTLYHYAVAILYIILVAYADQSSRIIFWLLEVFSREINTSLWDSSFALWQKLGLDKSSHGKRLLVVKMQFISPPCLFTILQCEAQEMEP